MKIYKQNPITFLMTNEQGLNKLNKEEYARVFSPRVKDAEVYLEELLKDDGWYNENKGKCIAISAHPKGYVIAGTSRLLRKTDGFLELGIWYRCRIDRDKGKRSVDLCEPNFSRPRVLRER